MCLKSQHHSGGEVNSAKEALNSSLDSLSTESKTFVIHCLAQVQQTKVAEIILLQTCEQIKRDLVRSQYV